MNAITRANICAIVYDFIDDKFVEIICQTLEIEFQRLKKSKPMKGVKSEAARFVTHAIHLILSICNNTQSLAT